MRIAWFDIERLVETVFYWQFEVSFPGLPRLAFPGSSALYRIAFAVLEGDVLEETCSHCLSFSNHFVSPVRFRIRLAQVP